jgi:hypothetical protein
MRRLPRFLALMAHSNTRERGYERALLQIYHHVLEAKHLAEPRPCGLEEAVVAHLFSAVGELEEQIIRLRQPESVDEIKDYEPSLRLAALAYLLDEYTNSQGRPYDLVRQVEVWKDYLGENQARVANVLAESSIHATAQLAAWLRLHESEFC